MRFWKRVGSVALLLAGPSLLAADEPVVEPLVQPVAADPSPAAVAGTEPVSVFSNAAAGQLFSNYDSAPWWGMYTDWSFRGGNQRVLGDGMVFVPLWQDGHSMVFADVRGQTDDQENYEGNWGLGVRSLKDGGWLTGAYAFYDLRRSETKNTFHQATFGVEMLSVDYEARINGYVPDMNGQSIGGGGGGPSGAFVSNGTIVIRSGSEAVERAYAGTDAEVGALLRDWEDGDVELRGFVGGYWFGTYASGYPDIAGPRARLELRTYDLSALGGEGSRVTAGVDYQWDQVRNDQVFASLQVRIPLGPQQNAGRGLDRLERRMLDRIVRDIDIVSSSRGGGYREELAIDPNTQQPYTSVIVVDAETDDVPGTVAAAGAGSTVVVDGSKGQIDTTASINLQNGQTLKGGGFEVEGAVSGTTTTFGTRPTVNATNMSQSAIVVADNSTVKGIDVVGGSNGISDDWNHRTNVTVVDNTVTGAAQNGFSFINFDGLLQGNTATGNGNSGFFVDFLHPNGELRDNTATNNGFAGYEFFIVDGTVTNNLASDNGIAGFWGFDFFPSAVFTDNVSNDNGHYGYDFHHHFFHGGTVSNNTGSGNPSSNTLP